MSTRLGVDIGGSGVKGAPVDSGAGRLAGARHRIATPRPATPDAVAEVVGQIVEHFAWDQPFGATVPAVVRQGVVFTAANIDSGWIGTDAVALLGTRTGLACTVINDADAAGTAEMHYGAGRGRRGVVVVLTFGTGIGSAVFVDGTLVPNTELGHLELDGVDAEYRAAASARKRDGLSWRGWAQRVDRYLHHVVALLAPDLIIVGGGVSKRDQDWLPHLTLEVEIVPAQLRNHAGIVGAALAAP